MYILKNAWRSISRAKVRNILIGVIVLVIAVSSCVALSIREAASSAREQYLEELEVTAQISMDRQSMMKDFSAGQEGGFDRDSMKEMLTSQEDLSLEELLTYAEAKSVKGFYYTGTTTVNTDDNWEPVDTTGMKEEETESDSDSGSSTIESMDGQGGMGGQSSMGGQGGRGGMMPGKMGTQGDATVVGYSSDDAMTDFLAGTSTITDGEMFEEGTEELNCVISDELATYNEFSVGDTIVIVNPNNEEESYELTIVGIYSNEQSGMSQAGMMGGFSTATDSANQIYMSYNALSVILEASEETAAAATEADADTEVSALANQISGTYTFATVEDYENFEAEAQELGLSEDYTISSSDLTSYEQSLEPLNNLSEYAMYFFIVILIIGGIILAVLNIFNIRERKYEIGVLAAIGMEKWKIAVQYTLELLCVTFIAIFIGAGIGAAGSVPITNALLEKQIASQTSAMESQMGNFGRGEKPSDMPGGDASGDVSDIPSGDSDTSDIPSDVPSNNGGGKGMGDFFNKMGTGVADYVTEIDSATNVTVLIQLMGVGILLTLISSMFAIIFVLRYDPLKIMANRE